jgi:phosphoglucosamine mutase
MSFTDLTQREDTMTKLFGADGIRGEIDAPPLDTESISRIAAAVSVYLQEKPMEPVCLIGSDTRESSQRLKNIFIDKLNRSGVGTVDAGILPTSAISFLVAKKGFFSAGLVFSASHNPANENGIKIFDEKGIKIKDHEEAKIENYFDDISGLPKFANFAANVTDHDFARQYVRQIIKEFKDYKWKNLNLLLDCANGASHKVAPEILETLGCKVSLINAWPDGININQSAGSEYARNDPDQIVDLLSRYQSVASISLDGDADRAVLIDKYRNYYDGDSLLAILGLRYKAKGSLKNNKVIATTMSNPALKEFMAKNKISIGIVSNGDKYVTSAILCEDLLLGGEQIGNLVIHDKPEWVTGDGIRTALTILSEMAENPDSTMMDMLPELKKYPQIVVSVNLDHRSTVQKEDIPGMQDLIDKIEFNYPDVRISQCRPASTESCYRLLIQSEITPVAILLSIAKNLGRCIYRGIPTNKQVIRALDCVRGGEKIL